MKRATRRQSRQHDEYSRAVGIGCRSIKNGIRKGQEVDLVGQA